MFIKIKTQTPTMTSCAPALTRPRSTCFATVPLVPECSAPCQCPLAGLRHYLSADGTTNRHMHRHHFTNLCYTVSSYNSPTCCISSDELAASSTRRFNLVSHSFLKSSDSGKTNSATTEPCAVFNTTISRFTHCHEMKKHMSPRVKKE